MTLYFIPFPCKGHWRRNGQSELRWQSQMCSQRWEIVKNISDSNSRYIYNSKKYLGSSGVWNHAHVTAKTT